VQKLVIDVSCGVGRQAEDEARAEEGWKERKEEVEAEFCGNAEYVIGKQSLLCPSGNDAKRRVVQVPQRPEGESRPHDPKLAVAGRLEAHPSWDQKR